VHRITTTLAVVLGATAAHADPTSGVDVALFRSSYDSNGLFSLEGARLLPAHDLSFKLLVDYAKQPIDLDVPGIGTGKSAILDYLVTTDMAFGMSLSDRIALGIDVAAYRTATGPGYGERGLYGAGGAIAKPSTGLIALRPLSNLDPSASPSDANAYLGDELAGPLDARLGVKVSLYRDAHVALAVVGSVFLPFGDENMLLGDRSLVFEPKLAAELRADRTSTTRVLANVAVRIRQRSVLESYDPNAMQTPDDARAFLDVGSEVVGGLGGQLELSPRVSVAAEGQLFVPLPDSFDWGTCYLYNTKPCSEAQFMPGTSKGDLTTLVTGGATVRISADVSASVMGGAGLGGARADELRITTALVWAPQPAGALHPGAHDRDGDGIPDDADNCPDDPEDKDGFQDEDGCPDLDNDGDGIPDAQDKCPNDPEDKDGFQDADGCPDPDNDNDGIPDTQDKCPNDPEDKDGFQDEDGCPDLDNDNDGFPDSKDKCPNDPETVNGFEDEDGCPDVRQTTGPEERPDRIDLKGQPISFGRDGKPTPAAKQLLAQVAAIIKARKLTIRVEVHVPLGVKSTAAGVIAAQKKKDKAVAQKRAAAILEYLVSQGVPQAQVQAVGIGSDRPLGTTNPSDPINDRIDFIKAQQ